MRLIQEGKIRQSRRKRRAGVREWAEGLKDRAVKGGVRKMFSQMIEDRHTLVDKELSLGRLKTGRGCGRGRQGGNTNSNNLVLSEETG